MKNNKITIIALALMTIFFTVIISSCENDPHDPDIELSGDISSLVPSYSANLSCSYNTSDKFIHLEAEPDIYLDMDKWGLKLEKVDFYVDDVYCESKTTSPFRFTYESSDWYTGAHTVRADLTITGKNIETLIFPCSRVIDNSSLGEKAADIYFDYNYVSTGDELCFEVCYNPERSAPNTNITSVTASWDNETLGEKKNAPFVFKKIITNAVGSQHELEATVEYTQGKKQRTLSFTHSYFEILGPTSAKQSYKICSFYRDYKNGEILRGKAKIYKGKEVSVVYGLELFLDNNKIAETKEFPFEHSYKLLGLSIGEHKLTQKWTRYDETGKALGAISTDEIITITK